MKTHAALVAQKLMNLYRSAFAIEGGWVSVNNVFMREADNTVLAEIEKLACGGNLSAHIRNLLSGKTALDSIETELLPYNGLMQPKVLRVNVSEAEFSKLESALKNFKPIPEHVDAIKNLPIVKRYGEKWQAGIRSILQSESLIAIWRNVVQSDRALQLWERATKILSSEQTDKLRAEVQADMLEYETYLPMFGTDGHDMLSRLRLMTTI